MLMCSLIVACLTSYNCPICFCVKVNIVQNHSTNNYIPIKKRKKAECGHLITTLISSSFFNIPLLSDVCIFWHMRSWLNRLLLIISHHIDHLRMPVIPAISIDIVFTVIVGLISFIQLKFAHIHISGNDFIDQ